MVPDYYARLDVDPKADRAEIEAALSRKQPAWSMGTRNPKNRHAYQLCLDEIPALRRALLGDPASRAAYDAELAAARRAEREANLDELQRMVRLRAAKGGLGPSDRGLLVNEATRLGLNEENLLRLIRPIPSLAQPVSVNGDAEIDVNPPADVLDPSTRRQIRVALAHLGCRDLYDALGVTRDAPASDIAARADAERRRWMKKAQVTAEKTAWLEVVAHAQSHLGSPRSRARYDRTLALEAEEAFDTLAGFTLKGLGRLDQGTRRPCSPRPPRWGSPRIAPIASSAAPAGGSASRRGRTHAAARPDDDGAERRPGCPLSSITLGGQRRGAVHPAAMPELRGRDRDQPGGPQGGVGALPALRGLAAVGLPGLPAHALGERAAMPVRVPPGTPRAGAPALRGGPAGVPYVRLRRRHRAPRSRHGTGPGPRRARNGLARVRQRQAEQGRLRLAYQTARAGARLAAARSAVESWSRVDDPQSPEIQAAWAELTPPLRRAEALVARRTRSNGRIRRRHATSTGRPWRSPSTCPTP